MEVEHIITQAAEKALSQESSKYLDQLRRASINEALSSRGKPVEVTASDVKRAAAQLRGIRADEINERFPSTYRLFTAYFWGGIAMSVVSLVFLASKTALSSFSFELTELTERLIGMIGLIGVFFAAASWAMRGYMKKKLETRANERVERTR